jgi:tetraacyldisaccharide 4'-kinase
VTSLRAAGLPRVQLCGTPGLVSARTQLEPVLTRCWERRGPLAWLLLPVALIFAALSAVRRMLYKTGLRRSVRLPVPVIVVGNVLVGGTGKTPLTIWLVDALQHAGYVPGVVSRGYGRQTDAPLFVSADSRAEEVGDEPLLIARRAQVPVVVGRQRVLAAKALLAVRRDVNVIVSDDGLQHYALQRDIEIVLFDARGAGNGWLLPAGPLRESASRRRDFTVINAAQFPSGTPRDAFRMILAGEYAECLSDRSQRVTLKSLLSSGRKIIAAAGIGNPSRFFSMLRDIGLVFEEMPLPDHYDFNLTPFADLVCDVILITEKDAVKCMQIAALKSDPRLWVVPVTAQIDHALVEQILEKLRGKPTA